VPAHAASGIEGRSHVAYDGKPRLEEDSCREDDYSVSNSSLKDSPVSIRSIASPKSSPTDTTSILSPSSRSAEMVSVIKSFLMGEF